MTPFLDDAIDLETYDRLVRFQVEGGSQGVVVTGTSGEPSALSPDERLELVRVAVAAAAERIPVVAATGSDSYAQTRSLSEQAAAAGADALLVVTPYYLQPPQRGLVEYFADIARRVDIPVLIYHIPGRTAVTLEAATIEAIVDRAPNVVGMKHASIHLGLVTETLRRLGPGFRIFAGLEELSLPMLAVGACGLMNAVGNLVPDRVVALWHAMQEQRLDDARKLHDELWELNRAVFLDTNPIPVKYMMRRLGILPSNDHRPPMVRATPDMEETLDGVLWRAGLIPGRTGD